MDRVLGGAVSILLAALAVYAAAQLVLSVWHVLAVTAGVIAVGFVIVVITRTLINRRRW